MAFIKILAIPGGASTCTKYYFRGKDRANPLIKRCIYVGEVAEVPDDELAQHLETGKVTQVVGPEATDAPKKRGRPPKVEQPEEYGAIFAAQR